MGDWKLVIEDVDKPNDILLFDLSIDRKEQNNIASKNPDVVTNMMNLLRQQHVTSKEFLFNIEISKK